MHCSELAGIRDMLSRRVMLGVGLAFGAAATRAAVAGPAAATEQAAKLAPLPVAVILGDNATLIDFAGPWEVLGSAAYAGCAGFSVYSVSATRDPIMCDDGRGKMGGMPRNGLTVVPDFRFDDAPMPRIAIMGAQSSDDPRAIAWIRHVANSHALVASVCTGAFLLAKTGLLDGHSATTNRNAYDRFAEMFPKVKLMRGVRFVESGQFATATGLTAGIDLALRVTERYYGHAIAENIAAYEEWTSRDWIVKN